MSDLQDADCLGEGTCMECPEGILSTSHHPDCPRFNGGGGKESEGARIPELPARLVETIKSLAARDAGESVDDPMLTVESVLSALYVAWPSIRREVLGGVPIRRELDLRRRQMARFPFCPDHRDKVLGKPCRECEVERLRSEVHRLHAWLKLIDGGDNPCRGEDQLRTWAYEATTLGRPAPGGQP